MKIIVSQTKQIRQYEPRRIEVHIDTEKEVKPWEKVVQEIVDTLDYLLYPENYVEFHQDPPSEIKELDEF